MPQRQTEQRDESETRESRVRKTASSPAELSPQQERHAVDDPCGKGAGDSEVEIVPAREAERDPGGEQDERRGSRARGAGLDHANPSARAACATSSSVCASQPIRTPQIASREATNGRRSIPTYATAASLYASSAGQTRKSATTLPSQLDELTDLALEACELRRDDHKPRQRCKQEHGVRTCDVFLRRAHASNSRSSRKRSSIRLPASSLR